MWCFDDILDAHEILDELEYHEAKALKKMERK